MTVTVADLYGRAIRRIGGRTGTMGTVTVGGSTTTIVLNGLVNTTLDDTFYASDRLIFPDAPAGSQEGIISLWDDSTGTATIANLATAPVQGERYFLVNREDYTLNEFNEAMDECLRRTPHSYRVTIPLVPVNPIYPLTQLPWLKGAKDVDAVWWSQSWNQLTNEEFSYWTSGSSVAPDYWTLSGSGATVARVDGFGYGGYAARVTRASNDAYLYQPMFPNIAQWLTRVSSVQYKVFPGAWVTCSTASAARIEFWNGSTLVTATDYHTGSGLPEFLQLASGYPITSALSNDLRVVCAVKNSDTSADFQRAVFWTGQTLPTQMPQYGSRFWWEDTSRIAPMQVRNEGGSPVVEIPRQWMGMLGQLVVTSRRYFPEVDGDLTFTFDEQYAEVLKAGLLRYLLWANKPDQDRTRLDRIMSEEANIWTTYVGNLVDRPVARPPLRTSVLGA